MRWHLFALLAYLAFVLQEGLRTLLSIGHTSPNLVLILMVAISMKAPRSTSAWAALILGLLMDLSKPIQSAGQVSDFALIGPACLGLLAGCFVVLQVRGLVFRDSPVSLAVLVLVAGIFTHLVIVIMLTMRGLPWLIAQPVANWNVAHQLADRFGEVLYSAVLALPIGLLKARFSSRWSLAHSGTAGPYYHAR